MKKTYVKPESSLMTLNFSESIVASTFGDDLIGTSAVIKFVHDKDGCRGYFTEDYSAPVNSDYNSSFKVFYEELRDETSLTVFKNCLDVVFEF